MQAYLVLLCFIVVLLSIIHIEGKGLHQQKRFWLVLLQYSLCYGSQEPNPQDIPLSLYSFVPEKEKWIHLVITIIMDIKQVWFY